MQYQFARDRLQAAVLLLAQESGPVQERLALVDSHGFQKISARDVPMHLGPRLDSLKRALTPDPFSSLELNDAQARQYAAEIIELYVAVLLAGAPPA